MNRKFVKANDYITALNQNRPKFLHARWRERTIHLIHGPREADKSTAAMDTAAWISSHGTEVLYVNVDGHYDHIDQPRDMVENLYVYTPEYESPDDTRDYADLVLEAIEEAAKTTKIRTVIVDSINRIAALSFGRNGSVAHIMKRLAVLQLRYKLSLLVVAHDSTRATDRALQTYADSVLAVAIAEPLPAPDKTKDPRDEGRVQRQSWREPVPIDISLMAVSKPQTKSNYFKKCTVDPPRKSRR